MRPLPTSYDDLHVDNYIASAKFELPVNDDAGSIMSSLKPLMNIITSSEVCHTSLNVLRCFPYFPEAMNLRLFYGFAKGCDVTLSNVAFSDRPWKVCGKEIKTITFHNNISLGITMALMAYSYNGKVRFGLQTKKYQKMDASRLLEILMKNIEEEI